MPKLLHVKFLLNEQDGAGRQDGDSGTANNAMFAEMAKGSISATTAARHSLRISWENRSMAKITGFY